MITESQIYWITRCDAIRNVIFVFTLPYVVFTLIILGILISVIASEEGRELWGREFGHRLLPLWILIGLPLAAGWIFVPTTKEMALIKVAPALANSELVQTTIPAEAKEIYALAKTALVEKLKGGAK